MRALVMFASNEKLTSTANMLLLGPGPRGQVEELPSIAAGLALATLARPTAEAVLQVFVKHLLCQLHIAMRECGRSSLTYDNFSLLFCLFGSHLLQNARVLLGADLSQLSEGARGVFGLGAATLLRNTACRVLRLLLQLFKLRGPWQRT